MFYYLNGTVGLLEPSFAVIDVGGVGYKTTITQTTYAALAQRQASEVRLYTHLAIREDDIELFGFISLEEMEAFKLLITVSGVGPKAAVSILSQLSPARLSAAIETGNQKAISQANGVGPKTAARIILELKGKFQKISSESFSDFADSNTFDSVPNSKLSDAVDALVALGYSKNDAQNVFKGMDLENIELNDMIRLALKKMMN